MMSKYANKVVSWYQKNKRELPWRKDKTPYHVWISEIMLQQTRIEAVIDYYQRFLQEIPEVRTLAEIREDRLLKLWEGLGYYNRARNLQKAAKIMMTEYQGNFPTTYEELIKLPGIGEYTASAISSICFNEKKVTVDGNVLRVISRVENISDPIDEEKTKRKIKTFLEGILPEQSGDFNEGLMELGEVICIPNGQPLCEKCPLWNECEARKKNKIDTLPIKKKKVKQKEYNYTVLIFKYQDKVGIKKRTEGLLRELWGFPMIEKKYKKKELEIDLKKRKIKIKTIKRSVSNKHIFTHQIWNMISYQIELETKLEEKDILFKRLEEIKKDYAIPTAYQKFLKELEKK